MIKVMFVCHGNICRSPMAEYIFQRMVDDSPKLANRCTCTSSATSTEEIWHGIGNPVYPPAKAELAKHGISCDGKRAVQIQRSNYHDYDLFIVMDQNNLRNLMRIFGNDPDGKIHKLLEFTDAPRDVADPWYSDRFDIAYQDIERGCRGLIAYLEENLEEYI